VSDFSYFERYAKAIYADNLVSSALLLLMSVPIAFEHLIKPAKHT